LQEDPETLYNVNTNSLTANTVINTYILDRLVYFDADGNPQGWLADSWEVNDDQTEITFTLRPGIMFHDGNEFTAEAVKFHFDNVLNPDNASPRLAFMGSLQGVTVIDDYTVKFIFETPYAPFFDTLAGEGFNSLAAVEAAGDEYGRQPIGTGPYMVEEWIPGSQITLVRNPTYQQ
jgi:peptide/nickel transport system substrate-binding protein